MKIGCWEVPKPSYPPLLWPAEWKAPAPFVWEALDKNEMASAKIYCFKFFPYLFSLAAFQRNDIWTYLLWVSFNCWCVLSQKHCVLVFSVSGMVRQWQCVRLKTRFLSKWESHKPTPAGSHHYCRTAHIKQIIIIIIISSSRTFFFNKIDWLSWSCFWKS